MIFEGMPARMQKRPEECGAFISRELRRWKDAARAANVSAEQGAARPPVIPHFTVTVTTGDTIGGANGICDQSPRTSCKVCWPGGSVTIASVCPPPKWMC